jgi:hypothetical protein
VVANRKRWIVAWVAGVALLLLAPGVSAQEDMETQGTALTITGGMEAAVDGSDANACVSEQGEFRAQLTPVATVTTILTFEVQAAGPAAIALGQSNADRVTLVSVSDDPNDFLINWVSSGGTLTVGSLDTEVPVGDGSSSTRGATGSIDADLSASGRPPVHVSGTWACHFST